MESVTFAESYFYDTGISGITVPVTLTSNGASLEIMAKVDTGAENCIFERRLGEDLGLEIDSAPEQIFSTVTSHFSTYQHELTLYVWESRSPQQFILQRKKAIGAMYSADKAGSTA